ncbi:MAG: hypothetical protein FDZ69_04715 [Deltaproteobacteria bacterium]|nr:MAG: hypothetical protein FDZ69_04715 [Deltaproteobacteria bacterium]
MFRKLTMIGLAALLLGGCAIGTTPLNVTHEPLAKIEAKKSGNILVRTFVDRRKEEHQYIGNKRNGFGMVLGHVGLKDGQTLEGLLTGYFAGALREAGYNAVIQGEPGADAQQVKFDAVVEGEIVEFWLDLYMKVWHNVEVKTRVVSPVNQAVLWERTVQADQSNVLWIGASGEFERVINEALTKALNQAAADYASNDFQQAVNKKAL